MREVCFAVLAVSNGLLREGLARILGAAHFRILASAASLDDSVLSVLTPHHSVLLVICSADEPDETAKQIELFKDRHQSGRVAVLAEQYYLGNVISAFRAGANAYLVNVTNCDAFIKSLESVMLGATIMPSEILPSILDQAINRDVELQAGALAKPESGNVPRLSTQERRILHYLVEGDSNKIIARKIDIAEATVKVHIKAILRKIGVHNRTQAAIWAIGKRSFVSDADTGSFVSAIANESYDLGGKEISPVCLRGIEQSLC